MIVIYQKEYDRKTGKEVTPLRRVYDIFDTAKEFKEFIEHEFKFEDFDGDFDDKVLAFKEGQDVVIKIVSDGTL